MEIEEVAKKDPKSIIVEPIDIAKGLTDATAEKVVKAMNIK